jgi:hypothetical protein
MAAVAGEAAWFGGAKRDAEPGCERSERRILADVRSMSARTLPVSGGPQAQNHAKAPSLGGGPSAPLGG